MVTILLACLLTAAQAYLLGSIIFGVLIGKLFFHDDVRTHGSGSAGMTNMIRNYGVVAGAGTAAGDVAKGAAAVLIGKWIFSAMLAGSALSPVCGAYLAAIFAVIGHTMPLFFGFKGGKGVLVSAGAALATEPLVCAVLLAIFLIEFAITRIVSLGSIIMAVLYPVATLCYWVYMKVNFVSAVFIFVCTAIMAVLVIYMHRENIRRLREGTEYRFGEKKNKTK